MISRRTFLKGSLAAAGAARLLPEALAKAAQPRTPVDFEVPAGACDCHVHIFGDPRRFPLFAGRTYTPETATVDELIELRRALHIDRTVVVQPSVYGTDNACTLDALGRLGASARGVAVIDASTPVTALDEMDRAGVRGIRLNLAQVGVADPIEARRLFRLGLERARDRNWHIQIFTTLGIIEAITEEVMASTVPVVFDHFGGALAAHGTGQAGFANLVNLVYTGKAYVKISGAADLTSTRPPDYPDVAPLARALVKANPQRILWGSNWPHPTTQSRRAYDISPLKQTDDGRVFNLLPKWVPDAATRRAILVENPAGLYRFPPVRP